MTRVTAVLCIAAGPLAAQGTAWPESWVGSEWELYVRALAARGLVDVRTWSIRPVAPVVVRQIAASIPSSHPWDRRLPRSDSLPPVVLLRPSLTTSYNSGFAWGMNDGAVWQGRGVNAWATAGASVSAWKLSVRVEPLVTHAANAPFALRAAASGGDFGSELVGIDLPQRPGPHGATRVDPGQSFVRADVGAAAIGLSSANVAWGPGIRNGMMVGANAGGFPHLFIGTNRPVRTPVGDFAGQLIYGSLSQTAWAPSTAHARRFGTGLIAAWMPFPESLELGVTRFYHRPWPGGFGMNELLAPFGSAFRDDETAGVGVADNQLASLFLRFRAPPVGLEVFGEFARNDRSANVRDLLVEPEHNAAWMLGLLHTTEVDSRTRSFRTTRIEIVNARISRIRDIGRGQAIFYTHGSMAQGHTQRGQLLGTPLAEQSGGIEIAVDRWAPWGRTGVALLERQLPGDAEVGMAAESARSQWDLGASATLFRGAADLHAQLGHVWDLNRLPGRDVGNFYLRVGARAAIDGSLGF